MATWPQLAQQCLSHALKGHVPPSDTLKLLVSKTLGYGIVAGACITKLPQILAVVRSGSAAGLSPLAFELESVALMIHTTYGALAGLPFSAYGEAAVLLVQALLLLALIYRLSGAHPLRVLMVVSALSAFAASVYTGKVGLDVIQMAFDANNLVMMSARLPQILSNWRAKATGQLSLTTCLINTVGCVTRIFTSITENAGPAMLRSYLLSLVLNSILVAQILTYAKNTKATKAKADKKKKQ